MTKVTNFTLLELQLSERDTVGDAFSLSGLHDTREVQRAVNACCVANAAFSKKLQEKGQEARLPKRQLTILPSSLLTSRHITRCDFSQNNLATLPLAFFQVPPEPQC
jgi:hypothetical protein